jgi:methylated-DNA-[protein]-cysteine S-methyltransferase
VLQELYYTYYESPIGILKIAGTETVIAEVSFVDSPNQMQHGEPGVSDVLHQCTEELIEFFSGKRRAFSVPIHQEGNDFSQQVWSTLTQITYGKTISFLELAKKVANEHALKAAASSNGKNKINIIVPCHRVIGTNKNLSNYAGGAWRKKWLLQHEFRTANGIQTLF